MKTGWSSSGTRLLIGYLAAFASLVTNALSASCVQALQGAIPDFQLSAIRSLGQGLTHIIGGLLVAADFKIGREYAPALIYYAALFLFFNVGFFGGATYLPLADVQGIVTIVSIVSALLQSKLVFKIEIAKCIIIATLVCVIGIVLVTQPAGMFAKKLPTSNPGVTSFSNLSFTIQPQNTSANYGYNEATLGYSLCILGGAAMGLTFDTNNIILHNVKVIPKITCTMLLCTVGSVVFMFYLEDPVYVIDLTQFVYIVGHSLFSAITTFLSVYAGTIIPGPSISIVFSLDLVTMLACQYTIMHSIKPGNYNWIEVIGCVIIVFGVSIPGVMDILAHKAKANELP